MGFRGALKQGGGFWNNVDGEIKDYTFTNVGPGKDGEETEWIYFVPTVHVDGADEATSQHLFLGAMDRYDISKDGKTLTANEGDVTTIGANTPSGKFLNSILEAQPDIEAEFPDVEGGEPLNLECLIGKRVRLKQQVDAEGTKKLGKRKSKDGKKEYDRTDTIVIAVYEGGAKPAGKAGKGTSGKAASAAKGKQADTALRDKADEAVKDLCEAAVDKKNPQGQIPTSKLSVGILRILSGDKQKDAVRKLVATEGYLSDAADRGVVTYDADENTVSLTE